ncbi:helix-turn-helix transcriptional regulator [Clostridium sp. OS1-26]|uniref:helix-turn-helix domain-containing protein n=1 Tax=Clostridium sp. OS1-26 TaxID=3070681 RepID=UPI0027DF642F|nr:helix-turn-helix transcriptional regulator [Clostridium sp. OS1-26]WML35384.1 helix-turn-helix transcriptional regulator [Clostridium sp. OS1-26]
MAKLGEKIKELRTSLNMTIKELSKKSGVGQSTISEIETGKAINPKTDTLQKISKVLGVTVNDLLSTEEKLDIALDSMSKIRELAKEGLNYKSDLNLNDDTALIKESNESYLNRKDEKDIGKALSKALEQLQSSQDGLMYDGDPIDDETRELLRISLENSMRLAKQIAKSKFTPEKYKK